MYVQYTLESLINVNVPSLLIWQITNESRNLSNVFQGVRMPNYKMSNGSDAGHYFTVDVNINSPIFLHVRGGHILPTQQPANNTYYRYV